MTRIFLSAGHGGFENGARDPGIIAGGTTEAQEIIRIRDLVVSELRSRDLQVITVPDDLSQTQTIDWINTHSRLGDMALELQTGGSSNPLIRGATAFYIAGNQARKKDAESLLLSLLQQVPQLPNRGAKPDTETGLGSLIFCRWIAIPSIYIELGFLTNPTDRALIQNRRQDIAIGIANGITTWFENSSTTPIPTVPPGTPVYGSIGININGRRYGENGILVNGNSYIPIDLVDKLGLNLSQISSRVRRIRYNNIVYIRSVDFKNFGISVGWDNPNRSVILRSNIRPYNGQIDQIMGNGLTTEVQLIMFIKTQDSNTINTVPQIAKYYREESAIEGVNHDIAFCQMCLETNFLQFGGILKLEQNNFGGLGSLGGASEIASFPTIEIGVRAHIQHLKAYASYEPLVQDIVDPRFEFVTRGIAPFVEQLSGRWSDDSTYGEQILALLRRLYEI
ncbi:MAG TPA: cell wall hydrolase [Planktothrix sp. UBA8407]|jgi:N-acetylmuramoyl-L-alanine amidase|nr:cell wall hydrolase [Planktothrix sp. UBA8402]HAO09633.1 cell wall hydrolase [Planktothrix sp. UBA8407]HBK23337.1 cell wall hydrolase [Planktothrix sp. UBA10369]